MSESSPAQPWPEFEPTALLRTLAEHRVDFVVIGGIAAIAHGSARLTQDLDITYATGASNLRVLGAALIGLKARLRGVDEDVPFVPDEPTLRRTSLLTLATSEGPLDLLAQPPGAPPYEDLRREAQQIAIGDATVLVASIDDLVAMKVQAGRAKDLADIEELDAIRRLSRER
jgi:predicted nucleotidyltransferase